LRHPRQGGESQKSRREKNQNKHQEKNDRKPSEKTGRPKKRKNKSDLQEGE